jgi:hypothetical protein
MIAKLIAGLVVSAALGTAGAVWATSGTGATADGCPSACCPGPCCDDPTACPNGCCPCSCCGEAK